MKCLACDGTGTYLYENDPPGKCPDCDGTGEVPENFYDGNAAMPDEIQPALTPEEWKQLQRVADLPGEVRRHLTGSFFGVRVCEAQVMALANAALPDDDPRKITRELWYALDQVVRGQWPTEKMREDALRVVHILAALLPPEG